MTLEEKVNAIEKRLNQLDKYLKEIEEKIKLSSIGFPVNFFGV